MTIIFSCFFRILCILQSLEIIHRKYSIRRTNSLVRILLYITFLFINIVTGIYIPYSSSIILLFILFIGTSLIFNSKFELNITALLFSHAIFYIFNYTSIAIFLFLSSPLYYFNHPIPHAIFTFFMGIFTFILQSLFFKTKIFKICLRYFSQKNFTRIGTIICLLILILKIIDNIFIKRPDYLTMLVFGSIFPLTTFLLAIILFAWWRKQITKSYTEKLRKLEVQSLYEELAEKEQMLKKLATDNESLSRLIHKDNKIIPAMENIVHDYLSGAEFKNFEEQKQYGQDLLVKLKNIADDRQGYLDSYENQTHKLKLTGYVGIDAILVYMKKKAENKNITFECRHSSESLQSLLKKISEDELTHILSDLLENSLIATNEQKNGRIQVTFGQLHTESYISVADNGTYFDIETLHDFGLRPHTTHKDSGGSGIGLMDIWNLKRKHRATIQIQEYERIANNFTKKIFFSFNTKNHYVIQSFRHAEITHSQTRGDLYVIPADDIQPKEEN